MWAVPTGSSVNVLINWTTIKSIHWYLVAEVEVNCKNCSPLGWWWLTQKLVILPRDCHSAFRACNSPFFRREQLFCLGFQRVWADSLYFWLSFLRMGQSCSKLPEHSSLVKTREALPGFSPPALEEIQPGVSSSRNLLSSSDSGNKLTQNFAPRETGEIQSSAEPLWIWEQI